MGLLGIVKAGGAYMPLDPAYPAERLAFMLQDAGAQVVVTRSELSAGLPETAARVVCLDRDWPLIEGHGIGAFASGADAGSLAYVIYTSGSTGTPKGVQVTHRAISRLVRNTDFIDIRPTDRLAQASVASFDAATFEIWGALLNGAQVIGVSREVLLSPREFSEFLRTRGITVLFLTTALFNQMAREAPGAFRSLRCVLFGGEAVDPDWVRAVLRDGPPQRLLHVYGPTEVTTFSTWHLVAGLDQAATTVPIGRPIANTTAYVLDEHREPVPVGVPGELYLGGDGLARGYLRRPELTAERFVDHPFSEEKGARLYRTGDWVRYLPDGAIEYIGRRDNQVKIRGYRIEPGEIEAALVRHPAVREAVAMAREDEPGDKRLVAYVTPGEAVPSPPELRAWLRERLPEYMVPGAFVVLDRFPLSPNGKVDRGALPAPSGERQLESEFVAPRGRLAAAIAAVWSDVLGVARVGAHDNFFDLGGNSLLLVSVHERLQQALDMRFRVVELFQYPTIESLARHFAGEIPAPATLAAARERAGRRRDSAGGFGAIAVIGMAGRFPGADSVEAFWRNLCDGVESIRFFTQDELRAAGVDGAGLHDPSYVPARGFLEAAEHFDAFFFGYTPREAELIDPQQRAFLEAASNALDNAGYDPERYPGLIGVYAGGSRNTYLLHLAGQAALGDSQASGMSPLTSDQDFLPTRVSYKLNLRGPSVNVQTACSTSLVAIHDACRALNNHECDMALAGGVSVTVPRVGGYLFQPDGIASPDGHCRPFDADARGTVPGEGVGVVVLKRLDEALSCGDQVRAVIRGIAVNNDGSGKVGFSAPSVEGQAEVIAFAQAIAGVRAESIGFVEAHGTATALGDPIEVAALNRVFGEPGGAGATCYLGAVKSNVG
ncbi:MAG TPA: amino acid adenylation domain-containing protein, partial [Quisquiliibacterium sp.]|nr:amino acid adenylation domain-containing protein [Quisquiliibacterium sp.]